MLVVISLAFFSCQGNKSSSTDNKGADSLTKASPQQGTAQSGDSETYMLPSPLQIASIIFKSSGFKYMPDASAPIKDAAQFSSHYEMAINLGVYSSDLSYCLVNKQNDDVTKYLNVVKVLSDKLGFGSIFKSNSFLQRFQSNMNNADSLASLIGELQMETDMYLESNGQKYINAIIYTGALVESMYISGTVYEKEKNSGESSCISEQMDILDGLTNLLTQYQSADNNIPGLITQLKELKTSYESFDEVKNKAGDKAIIITSDHINQLYKMIKALRDKFVAS